MFSVRTWRKDSIFAHSMRYLTSDIVLLNRFSILNGVLVVDHSGIIVDVLRNKEGLDESMLEYFEGLMSGFINTHCHLSYLI